MTWFKKRDPEIKKFVQTVHHYGSLMAYRACRVYGQEVTYGPLRVWELEGSYGRAEQDLENL